MHRSSPLLSSPQRRGNYSLMVAAATVAILGMGALTIDVAYMRLAHAQAQDVADAASNAALIVLRQTGSQSLAEEAARKVISSNVVAGYQPMLSSISFGHWDTEDPTPELLTAGSNPNAVRVEISREGDNAVPLSISRLFGKEEFDVWARSTSATRSFQIAFVMDITNSWSEKNFLHAREGALISLEMLANTATGLDEVGMTMFTNRFAWEYTPFTQIAIPANANAVEDKWELLNTASKAGVDSNHSDGKDCTLHTGTRENDFNYKSVGGCYPKMPREYRDEPGTDHSTGMLLAKQMFEESLSVADYRAMIVLTDGQPNGLGVAGVKRGQAGYVETRWREYLGPAPRTTAQIRTASIAAADDMWEDLRVNTWVISFVADDWMMDEMAQGDGYYIRTSKPSDLEPIMAQIISELPLAIVE